MNASAGNSRPIRSVNGNLLNIAASRLKKRGPVNLNRLMFPAVAGVVTCANAEVSNHAPLGEGPIPPRTENGPTWLGVCLEPGALSHALSRLTSGRKSSGQPPLI